MSSRGVELVRESVPTLEGAGVQLRRVFGHGMEQLLDPFLMMDDFRGDHPSKYERGFPWHPHRGIETITYMLEGDCDHSDSLGNAGTICPGDVQWMTAGSGIIHQEMPHGDETGRMGGFQLWANLPASDKMREPRYQGIQSVQIPEVESNGARIRVVAGRIGDVIGPVSDITVDPEYLDVTLGPQAAWEHTVPLGYTAFAYLFQGEGGFGADNERVAADDGKLVLFGDGDLISVSAGEHGVRFLLISGKPLHEPIAWRGPIVMNTRQELDVAWREIDEGTFVKHGPTHGRG